MSDAVTRLNTALEGRYEVEREIGEGGMATVYLARDVKHNRSVALKVLKPELAAVVGADRFLAEIETTANLQHPHILPLFDSGEADSFLFYVMPYIEGETLADRIHRDKQLPVDEALYIATSVANALQVAHEAGVIHRDIKPSNILLSRGEPLVSDFGIALAVGAAGGNRLTETGLSVGTPFYMSPEQATGDQAIGPASDTYALACVLYEMLVGEPPYLGNTAQAVLGKIIQGLPVSATAARKAVPAHVDAAIRKALEKLPADRFTQAGTFAKALSDQGFTWGEAAEVGGRQDAGAWRRLALGSAAVAVVTTLGLSWAMLQPEPEPPVSRQVITAVGFPLAAPIGDFVALAPDGSGMVLPQGTSSADVRLAFKARGSLELTDLPGTEQARHAVYSPDGEWVVFVVGTELLKRPLVGGSTVTLADDTDNAVVALTWLDDGTIVYEREIAGQNATTLVRISEDGGTSLGVLFDAGEGSARDQPIWAHGLPGSSGVLFVTCPGNNCSAESSLQVVDLDGGPAKALLDDVLRAWYVETGHVVYVRRDGAVFSVPFDLRRLEFTGGGVPLFEDVRVTPARADLVLGADGSILYVEGGSTATQQSQIYWVNRQGRRELVDPALEPQAFLTLALSPSDDRLAVDILGPESRELWVKELPDGPLTRLTNDPGRTRRPVWSFDASTITYITDADETADATAVHLRTVRSDGSSVGQFDLLLARDRSVLEGVFTPDETGLIFREGDANIGDADLAFVDLATGEVNESLLASEFNERAIALSPDGQWLAYVSDVTGRDEVFVRPFPETSSVRRQVSTNGGFEPVWAHNGREIFFREPATGSMMVATYAADPTFQVTSRESLFDASDYLVTEASSWHSYDVTNDDQRFVMVGAVGGDEGDPGRLVLIQDWFTELRARLD